MTNILFSIPTEDGHIELKAENYFTADSYGTLYNEHGGDCYLTIVMQSHLSDVQMEVGVVAQGGTELTTQICDRCNFVKWLINRYAEHPMELIRIFPKYEYKIFKTRF